MKFDFIPIRVGHENPNLQDYRYSPIIGIPVDFIVVIFDQVYERFMMEFEDLKSCLQENVSKQVNETIKCIDS